MSTTSWSRLKTFTRKLTIYSLVLLAAYALFILLLPGRFVSDVYFAFIPFFYLVTLLTKLILARQQARSSQAFANGFILTTIIRFMLYVAVLLIYSFSFPDDAIPFIITFFVFYFMYSMIEVSHLYHNLKK